MTRIEKNRTKKQAKVFTILAWTFTLLFFTNFFLIICHVFKIDDVTLRLILVFGPLVIAMVFMFAGMYKMGDLRYYRYRMNDIRQTFYMHKIIDLIQVNDIQGAVDIYNDCLKNKHYRMFMHGYFVAEFRHSDDEKWQTKAKENLQRIFDDIKV